MFKRALAIYEKAAGPEHPAVATLLNNLGQVSKVQGRYAEAEPLIRRSLAIREKVLGPDHPDVARSLNNLADLYERRGRHRRRTAVQRALSIRERAVGADHPDTAISANNLALLPRRRPPGDALPLVQRMIGGGRAQLRVALPVLFDAQRQQLLAREKALDDALNVIQRGTQSSAASAVNKLAVRIAAGNDRLAELVRREQDLGSEADALDKAIVAAVSKDRAKRDAAAEARAKARLVAIAERASLAKNVGKRISGLLRAVESIADDGKGNSGAAFRRRGDGAVCGRREGKFCIAITREGFDWKPLPLGAEALSQKIAAFRRGLDLAEAARPPENPACSIWRSPTNSTSRCSRRSSRWSRTSAAC